LYIESTLKITTNTLSLDEFELSNHVKIYPNPSSDFIQISGLIKAVEYKLYDMTGKKISNGITSNNKNIDIQNLTEGLYFLKFENEPIMKFIKK